MNLEFFIRLRDMVSGGLAKVAQTAQKTNAQMKSANGMLAQSYDQIKNKISELESVISKSTSVKHIREAKRELEGLQRMAKGHAGNLDKGSGNWFTNGIKQALPVMGVAGMMALGGSMLTSGLQAQARQASFEVMAGKEGGAKLNKDLTKYAQDSIYGNEVYQNAQTMLGFGMDQSKIMDTTKMLGDVAMGNSEKLGSLTLAFSQVRAAGKLTGQDLIQFVNAGFNPLEEISKKTGIGMGQLKEAMSDGLITFDMVEAAFNGATSEGGRYYKMTETIANTDYGKMQAFIGQLEGVATKVGGFLAPIAGFVVQFASDLLNGEPAAVAFALALGALTVALNWNAIAAGWAAVATFSLSAAWAATPIGVVVAGLIAIAAGALYVWNKFEGLRMVVYGLWGSFKQVFENIGGLFKKIFEPIFEAITAFKEGRYVDAAKAVGKMAFNLTPVGLAANAIEYAKDGGLTKGVKDAYNSESLRGIAKKETSVSPGKKEGEKGVYDTLLQGGKGKSNSEDEAVKGITSGGPRVININGVRFADTIEIHAQSFEKGMDNVKDVLDEYLLRILNSGAAMQ